jgi:EmrB/QacA subfamily drug resistance transporter
MGVGGALMWPAILGMTYAALPEDKAGLAGGLVLGVCGLGNAAGPLLGGALTDALSWRWVFYVNVPITLLAALITIPAIHQHESERSEQRIDFAGAAALAVGLVALLVALDQATDWGWGNPRVIALLVVSATLVGGFVVIERRTGNDALVPGEVMGSTGFAAACVSQLLVSAVFFASVLYLPQFMQKLLGYTPVKSGLGMLPLMATFALGSFVAGPLYSRLGAKVIVSLGASALVIGIFLLSLVDATSGYDALIAGMVVVGLGVAMFYASITTAAVTAVDASRAALAGGIVYMFQIAGGSIGLGLNTSVFSAAAERNLDTHLAALSTRLSDTQSDLALNILAGTRSAKHVVAQVGSSAGHELQSLVRDAFVSGLHAAFRMDAALALAGLAVALLFVGGSVSRARLPGLRRCHHNLIEPRSEGDSAP